MHSNKDLGVKFFFFDKWDLSSYVWQQPFARRSVFPLKLLVTNPMSSSASTTDLSTVNLESHTKRELEGLCRKYHLSFYGLKSQLLARLRNHRATLHTSVLSSTAPPASNEPEGPTSAPSPTSTPLASRQNPSNEAAAFTPEQQAYIERLIASHVASAGTVAGPSTSTTLPPTLTASASLPIAATHGGVGESSIIIVTNCACISDTLSISIVWCSLQYNLMRRTDRFNASRSHGTIPPLSRLRPV